MFLLNVVVNKYIRDVKPPHIYSHFGNYPGGGHLSWGASVRIPALLTTALSGSIVTDGDIRHMLFCNIHGIDITG